MTISAAKTNDATSEAAILARLLRPGRDDLSVAAARSLLKLDFVQEDRDRIHDLILKNQEGALTEAERSELDSYRRVGYLLDLMHSRARLALKKKSGAT